MPNTNTNAPNMFDEDERMRERARERIRRRQQQRRRPQQPGTNQPPPKLQIPKTKNGYFPLLEEA